MPNAFKKVAQYKLITLKQAYIELIKLSNLRLKDSAPVQPFFLNLISTCIFIPYLFHCIHCGQVC